MRRFATIVILLGVAYFAGGWIAVHWLGFDNQKFLEYGSIVGGILSVISLLSLTRPGITSEDLQDDLEFNSLKSVAPATEEINELKTMRARTAEEIDNLGIKKKEMEILVRKESLSLFLNHQLRYYQIKISAHIDHNSELVENIKEYSNVSERLRALGEEIAADPNVGLLEEVLQTAKPSNARAEEFEDLPPTLRAMARILKIVLDVLAESVFAVAKNLR
jgi:hypothetical protein